MSGKAGDHLTASDDVIAKRDPDGRLTLADCFRSFVRRRTPPIIGSALLIALAARISVGNWSWRDPLIALVLVAAEPFVEWFLHVVVLHSRPIRIGKRRVEIPSAREHRKHHEEPADLDGVLVTTSVLLVFIPLIALVAFGIGFALNPLLGGDRVAQTLTGITAAYSILMVYEWCHFLIHSPYVPRWSRYASIRRSHRLHHFKNEHYWFGITSNLGDRVIGTYPEAGDVPKSSTARNLDESLGIS